MKSGDTHATALSAYWSFSIDLRIHANLRTQRTTWNHVGCVSNPWEFTRCHSDQFRPCTIHIDLFRCFYAIFDVSLLIPDLLLLDDYLCVPHTMYTYRCISDLLRPFVDFIYLRSYRYSDVLIIYSYGRLRYYYRFGLRSYGLLDISDPSTHFRPLRGHFYLYLLPLPFYTE